MPLPYSCLSHAFRIPPSTLAKANTVGQSISLTIDQGSVRSVYPLFSIPGAEHFLGKLSRYELVLFVPQAGRPHLLTLVDLPQYLQVWSGGAEVKAATIQLFCHRISEHPDIPSLTFRRMRKASVRSLGILLGENSAIQRFQVHDLHVDVLAPYDRILKQLATSLAVNTSLVAFSMTETHMYYCENLVMLLSYLGKNRWLQDVDLSGTHPMSEPCVPSLVEFISHNTRLKSLTLDSCGHLCDIQVTAILHAAVGSNSLERLSLKNVSYGDKDGLITALRGMDSLKELYLNLRWRERPSNRRDIDIVDRSIVRALESNQSLTAFSGGENWDRSHKEAVQDILWRNRCWRHLESNQYDLSRGGCARLIETAATKWETIGADVIFDLLSSKPGLVATGAAQVAC